MNRNSYLQKGFTLIETLIYIGLFSLLLTGGMIGVYGIIEGSDKTNAKTIVEQEGLFIERKLNWAMTGATAASVTGTSRLTVSKGVQVNDFNYTGTTIEMNGVQLNSDNARISSLNFTEVPATVTRPKSIKATFIVVGTKGDSQTFETTKYLR